MPVKLTNRQEDLLRIIQAAPHPLTLKEMAEAMGIKPTSASAVCDALTALQRKGYIRRADVSYSSRQPITVLHTVPGPLNAELQLDHVRQLLADHGAWEDPEVTLQDIADHLGIERP